MNVDGYYRKTNLLFVLLTVFIKPFFGQGIDDYTIRINEIVSKGSSLTDENNDNDDWVEIYNYGDETVNLENLYFSDDKNEPKKFKIESTINILPQSYHVLWLDNEIIEGDSHLGFKLSDGESLIITSESGVIDELTVPYLNYNTSYGRSIESDHFLFFLNISFGQLNAATGFEGIVPKPIASYNSGAYTDPIDLQLLSGITDSDIYYTIDGSNPTQSSKLYTSAITLSNSTVIKYKAFKEGFIESETNTNVFVYEDVGALPVLYVTSENSNIRGSSDVLVHAELVDEDGEVLFSQKAGSQKHGDNNQESFKLFFRSEYGAEAIDRELFKDKSGVKGFKRLIFRQSGNDGLNTSSNKRSHLRDGFISKIVSKGSFGFKSSGYEPVTVYLNGNYHGIFNMRERIDKFFIENNYDYDDDLDKCFIEYRFGFSGNVNAIEGTFDYFNEKIGNYSANEDLSIDVKYDEINNYMDINDFTDYWIHEVYVGNFDWLSNNMYFWSPLNQDVNKFRWILWDTDIGMGFNYQSYGKSSWNSLEWSTSPTTSRSYSGGRNRIIRNLLENDNYKTFFITRFCDLINSEYQPDYLISLLAETAGKVRPEIQNHINKWSIGSIIAWEDEIKVIEDYILERPDYVHQHIKDKFNLDELYTLNLTTSSTDQGTFQVNTLDLKDVSLPWVGKYFDDIPLKITATPLPGYKFVEWIGTNETSQEIILTPSQNLDLIAVFEEIDNSTVVINEISYSQDQEYDSEDWIELYNNSESEIDLSGWKIKDDSQNEAFIIKEGQILGKGQYLVLCKDSVKFKSSYPEVYNFIGDLGFGLSKAGESISVFNKDNDLIDIVAYSIIEPWPGQGQGNSIELSSPNNDNMLGENWESSFYNEGTPGFFNSNIVGNDEVVDVTTPKIFPNPAINEVNFDVSQEAEVVIMDIYGRSIMTFELEQGLNKVNLDNIIEGVYIFNLTLTNGEKYVDRILIKS